MDLVSILLGVFVIVFLGLLFMLLLSCCNILQLVIPPPGYVCVLEHWITKRYAGIVTEWQFIFFKNVRRLPWTTHERVHATGHRKTHHGCITDIPIRTWLDLPPYTTKLTDESYLTIDTIVRFTLDTGGANTISLFQIPKDIPEWITDTCYPVFSRTLAPLTSADVKDQTKLETALNHALQARLTSHGIHAEVDIQKMQLAQAHSLEAQARMAESLDSEGRKLIHAHYQPRSVFAPLLGSSHNNNNNNNNTIHDNFDSHKTRDSKGFTSSSCSSSLSSSSCIPSSSSSGFSSSVYNTITRPHPA